MRVAYLTAGAAGMYCGSCLRDNALAAALREQGRDVLLAPLYTPIRTDELDASEHRVLYGGLSVYLQHKSRLFRYLPRVFDRLLDSTALLRRITQGSDGAPTADMGRLTVSMLKGQDGAQARELRKLIDWLRESRVDLVNLPNAMFVGTARAIREALAIPVLCTLTGEDLFLDALPEPWRTQAVDLIRREAAHVDAFVAVTHYYAAHVGEHFQIPADRLQVVPLGVRTEDLSPAIAPPPDPFTIGYLARVCPEKGLHVLCEAVRMLRARGRRCRLLVAGYLSPSNRAYLAGLSRCKAGDSSETGILEYVGEVDRQGKADFLRSLHVFSVPTEYREAKGLYVLEALAAGVPVVQPDHGAFPELIAATGGGRLVRPGDPGHLAEALGDLMDQPGLRQLLGRQGREAVLASYTSRHMAERTWKVYEECVGAGLKGVTCTGRLQGTPS